MSEVFSTMRPPRRPTPAQRRAQRRRKRIRAALVLFLACMLVVTATVVAVPLVKNALSSNTVADYPGPGTGETIIEIPEGATGKEIAEILAKADVVASPQTFATAFSADPRSGSIQPGAYKLKTKMSAQGAVSALLDPASRAELKITIPEGFANAQIAERVANVLNVSVDEVNAVLKDGTAIGLPPEANGNAEGWLEPSTYQVSPNASAKDIISDMVALRLENLEKLDLPREKWERTIIVASIVEREVNWPDYYGQVARVIENRLADTTEVHGKLQMDSTTLYGVGKFGGVPTDEDLTNDNPYNTYLHEGLPPFPISNPSIDVIKASINPPEGDWLYFVTVDLDTGETRFTNNLEEHSKNVEQLRKWFAEHKKD